MGRVMTVITEGYEDCLAVSGILKKGNMSWEGMMWIFAGFDLKAGVKTLFLSGGLAIYSLYDCVWVKWERGDE